MKYFIANWKSNKNHAEAFSWLAQFQQLLNQSSAVKNRLIDGAISIVLCPSFPFLIPLKEKLMEIPNYHLGAQNISPFATGSFTGEVAANQLRGIVKYTIVGHSERRAHFAEAEQAISQKIQQAKTNNIQTILCVRGVEDTLYPEADIVAYEPVESIGTGKNAGVDQVLKIYTALGLNSDRPFLYGGSADVSNCREYLQAPQINGLLIGGASLDPKNFFMLLTAY